MSIRRAKEVLRIEAEAIRRLIPRVGKRFEAAVSMLAACRGRVIVTGMGKAGIVGQKLSATLASTGTPSHWVHPAEAVHGDVGRITKDDVIVALSNSGETEELTRLLPVIKRIGSRLIAMSGNVRSTLARHSDVTLDVSVKREACSLNLAPTSSTAPASVLHQRSPAHRSTATSTSSVAGFRASHARRRSSSTETAAFAFGSAGS